MTAPGLPASLLNPVMSPVAGGPGSPPGPSNRARDRDAARKAQQLQGPIASLRSWVAAVHDKTLRRLQADWKGAAKRFKRIGNGYWIGTPGQVSEALGRLGPEIERLRQDITDHVAIIHRIQAESPAPRPPAAKLLQPELRQCLVAIRRCYDLSRLIGSAQRLAPDVAAQLQRRVQRGQATPNQGHDMARLLTAWAGIDKALDQLVLDWKPAPKA
jgi:transposase